MSDNRVTSRFDSLLISQLDAYRSRFFMSRSEFVRYCVQMHLNELNNRENEQYKRMSDEIDYLRKRVSDLASSNASLMSQLL